MNTNTTATSSPDWARWKAIYDRIVAHPGFRYGDARMRTLGPLSTFAQQMLGAMNCRHHRAVNPCAPYYIGEVAR